LERKENGNEIATNLPFRLQSYAKTMYLQNISRIFYPFTYELKQKPLFLRTSRKQESTFSYLFRTKPYIPISPPILSPQKTIQNRQKL